MADEIWAKDGVATDAEIQDFVAGGDASLDAELFLFDLAATRAHVGGLGRIGVLGLAEVDAMGAELEALGRDFLSGAFVLDGRFEDGHSAIEARLCERLGDTGKRVHTGRSRNDQVQVALRLYLRDRVAQIAGRALEAAGAFLERASRDGALPMPGYTHLQRAVPSSAGLWLAAFAESFVDCAELAHGVHGWLASCPLGTGAGYGVNLPLDRAGVARELGFSRLQVNPMYVQNSRGRFELVALSTLGQALLELRRFAWDLSLYTSAEFGFVGLPVAYTTGSSLMPNKKNPDVVELLRAAYGVVHGAEAEVASALSLPSGYHRDLQATKAPLLRAMRHGLHALALLPRLVRGVSFDAARMRAAISPEMYATDRAIALAAAGTPFRDAYRQVARDLDGAPGITPEQSLGARVSPGATADLRLDELGDRLAAAQRASARLGAPCPPDPT